MADPFDSGAGDESQEVDASQAEAGERSDEELLKEAHAFIQLVEDAESENRQLALEDLKFAAGEQWPERVKQDRDMDGRPCLVINRIPQFIQQVTNDQRQNRPSIKAHPVDDHADVETAKVIQGLIRHIEYNSNADTAFDTAFDYAAKMGWGYFRVITDFCDPLSFEQEILIKKVRNPFSVFFDPYAQEADGSDATKAAITEDYSPEEYKARFPHSKLAQKDEWDIAGNSSPDWMPSGAARVAEYFYKDTREETLVLLSNGEAVLAREANARLYELNSSLPVGAQPISAVRQRRTLVPVIKWCKLNAVEILEKTEWPGKYIPIIPVYGSDQFINGKRILKGLVRDAKDPQRMYNYWASAETEAIALAPRAPFLAAEGQLEGHEGEWATANRRNHPYLTYKPTTVAGQLVGPPQRQSFEPAVQAITQARMMASDDLKATTGLYDAARGAQSNETSGVAIRSRAQQAQTSNFHFIDNLTRSLKHTGRILVDLIPKIYDTERTARIIGEDGEQKIIKVNAPFEQDGKPVLYALDAGKYDITVDVGPSFASKRQEAVAAMLEVTKANPAIMQIAGDLMIKNMDWPGSAEIAERLKKMLPPPLQGDDKKQPEIPPQVQAQMAQMQQMMEQLTAQLNEAEDALDKKRLEIESRERIEMKKLEVQLEIEAAKLDQQHSLARFDAEISEIKERQQYLRMNQPVEDPMQAQMQMQQEQQQMPPEHDSMMAPPSPDGASYDGAEFGDGGLDPTGGVPPGTPLE